MYRLSRLMLILAVPLIAYCFVAILGVKQQVPPDKQGMVAPSSS